MLQKVPDNTTKAIILARGLGSRMREDADVLLTEQQAQTASRGLKAMINVGRPFLDYILYRLVEVGINQVCLVVGPEHTEIREYYQNVCRPKRLHIHFAIQKEPDGTADALLAARPFAEQDSVIVLNADNLYPIEALERLNHKPVAAMVGFNRQSLIDTSNIPPERIRHFAACELNTDGTLAAIHEKPSDELMIQLTGMELISMNCWRFKPSIFKACMGIEYSERGELELTDAVNFDIKHHGMRYQVYPCDKSVLDLSYRKDIQTVTEILKDVEVSL